MIIAKVSKKQGFYYSFTCEGHAGYDDYGKDIVCAAVSMLVINTANSIDELTSNDIEADNKEHISWRFKSCPDDKATLLMDSLLLGLHEIQRQYGKKYFRLIIEEV